jgi:hypothetical protein
MIGDTLVAKIKKVKVRDGRVAIYGPGTRASFVQKKAVPKKHAFFHFEP